MTYRVEIAPRARKAIGKMDESLKSRVIAAARDLARDPRPPGCKKLKAHLKSTYRVRVGDWRLVYSIEDSPENVVLVEDVDHRSDVYR